MGEGVQSLIEREKEILRLLLIGHDAKSIARNLDLSVHTVNERLREARRKLGVSSSREAARLLAQHEGPNSLGTKEFGLAPAAPVTKQGSPSRRQDAGRPLVWLGGGMIIMALIIAALLAAPAFLASSASQAPPAPPASAQTRSMAETAQTRMARDWLALLDAQRWDDSWEAAGETLKSAVSKEAWPAGLKLHRDLGAVSSRVLQTVTSTTSMPGAPPGAYEVIQFRTSFAKQPEAIETVQLFREASGWKVDGYFIR